MPIFPPKSSLQRPAARDQSEVGRLLEASQRAPGSTIYRITRDYSALSDFLKIAGKPPVTLEPTAVPTLELERFAPPIEPSGVVLTGLLTRLRYWISVNDSVITATFDQGITAPDDKALLIDWAALAWRRTAGAATALGTIKLVTQSHETIVKRSDDGSASGPAGAITIQNLYVPPGTRLHFQALYTGNAVDQQLISVGAAVYAYPPTAFPNR